MDDRKAVLLAGNTPPEVLGFKMAKEKAKVVSDAIQSRIQIEAEYSNDLKAIETKILSRQNTIELKNTYQYEYCLIVNILEDTIEQAFFSDALVQQLSSDKGPLKDLEGYAQSDLKDREKIVTDFYTLCDSFRAHHGIPSDFQLNLQNKEMLYKTAVDKVEATGETDDLLKELKEARRQLRKSKEEYEEKLKKMAKYRKHFYRDLRKLKGKMIEDDTQRIELLKKAITEYVKSMYVLEDKRTVRRMKLGVWKSNLDKISPEKQADLELRNFPYPNSSPLYCEVRKPTALRPADTCIKLQENPITTGASDDANLSGKNSVTGITNPLEYNELPDNPSESSSNSSLRSSEVMVDKPSRFNQKKRHFSPRPPGKPMINNFTESDLYVEPDVCTKQPGWDYTPVIYIGRSEPFSQEYLEEHYNMVNIKVIATAPYGPDLPTHLKLMPGQFVKQLERRNADGLCYGYTRRGPMIKNKKVYGFYPANHVRKVTGTCKRHL